MLYCFFFFFFFPITVVYNCKTVFRNVLRLLYCFCFYCFFFFFFFFFFAITGIAFSSRLRGTVPKNGQSCPLKVPIYWPSQLNGNTPLRCRIRPPHMEIRTSPPPPSEGGGALACLCTVFSATLFCVFVYFFFLYHLYFVCLCNLFFLYHLYFVCLCNLFFFVSLVSCMLILP